jgi:L-threonylcarbamoyladenylate synthase
MQVFSGHDRVTRLVPPFSDNARRTLVRALTRGAVMTYPTETSYALGGNALDSELCAKVIALKGRAEGKALLLLIGSENAVGGFASEVHPAARVLMGRFWPGALTLVFQASPNAPPHLVDARGTIALRWSPHPVPRELLEIGGVPLIGTSANRAGEPALCSASEVLAAFPGAITLAIDGGLAPGGAPSTVLDTTVVPFRILREGALPKARIQATLVDTFIETVPE